MQQTTLGIAHPESTVTGSDPRIAFAMRLARALHRYGTPTHRLEEAMAQVMSRIGVEGIFFSIPTGIFAGFGAPEEHRTSIIRADLGEIHLEKLSLIDGLVRKLVGGEVDVAAADNELNEIVRLAPRYGHMIRFVCFA